MLNLEMFGQGNQPALGKLPTLQENDEGTDSANGSNYDSDYDSDYDSEYDSDPTGTNDHSSTTEPSTGAASLQSGNSATVIGIKESNRICLMRGFVLVVLMFSTTLLAALVNHSSSRNEYEHFEAQYSEHATKIIDSFVANLEHGVGEVDSLAVSITSYTEDVNKEYPYISIPQFDLRAASTRKLADAALVSFVPKVKESLRESWESFVLEKVSTTEDQSYGHSRILEEAVPSHMESLLREFFDSFGQTDGTLTNFTEGMISDQVYRMDGVHKIVDDSEGPYFPLWQHSPYYEEAINYNLASHESFGSELDLMVDSEQVIIGKLADVSSKNDPFRAFHSEGPVGAIYFPLFNSLSDEEDRELAGLMIAIVRWTDYLATPSLPTSANGIVVVLRDGCGQEASFEVVDEEVTYLGEGDLHDEVYDLMEESLDITLEDSLEEGDLLSYSGVSVGQDHCQYSLHVYPAKKVENVYTSHKPVLYAAIVVIVFVVTAFSFVYYDTVVEQKQRLLTAKAQRSHQIISSLFPANFRDRLFGSKKENDDEALMDAKNYSVSQPLIQAMQPDKLRLKTFLNSGEHHKADSGNKPIADLFARCTCLFADIQGFTAWASTREPAQVFVLLETVYSAFDKIAIKRRVFKVETIGDCYVAATGLPDPQPNHATLMVKFARECLDKFSKLARKLETELGPDTGDLRMRFGIHSGPVTAGVLRGQKARFQLFGDTVNTASRMESTGLPNKIQCSQATANLLLDAGKGDWLNERDDAVEAKGKGTLRTYWVSPISHSSSAGSRTGSAHSSTTPTTDDMPLRMGAFDLSMPGRSHWKELSSHEQRLIGWTVELLSKLLKDIIAHRQSSMSHSGRSSKTAGSSFSDSFEEHEVIYGYSPDTQPRDEYEKVDVINMPKFDSFAMKNAVDPDSVKLSESVQGQLRDYLTTIARSYPDNPFHNFEHASHVTMSVNKLLKRIAQAEDLQRNINGIAAEDVSEYTHGISSDPLTLFACAFSALVHDVDHAGLGNHVLVKEKDELAEMYNNKSVLEQNSIDIAWELLMDPAYADLRACIYTTEAELRHFRKLVVNLVMATDIFDSELISKRNERWRKAFEVHTAEDRSDLKATIVIEHIIQASDVCHTMQHWHVYQKWNQRFFLENYAAFTEGRVDKNPADGWYKGELWFFDNYVVPLAKKLKDCQVFGASSDEFLTYATCNRDEWEVKGEGIVREFQRLATANPEDNPGDDKLDESKRLLR